MKKKLKIGILGCGAVAYRWYLKGLTHRSPDYELSVVCDIAAERAKKAAKDFNVPDHCSDIAELVRRPLDLVVVLTRHEDHYEHVKFLLNKGISVYSEKPFADSYEKGLELVKLARKKGLVFGSAPQIMLSSRNKIVKKFIQEGAIGKITFIRASCSNLGPAGRADTDYDPEWFYNHGGSMASLGIYGLSLLIWLMGVPKRVSCFEGIAIPERTVMYGPVKNKRFKVTAPDNVVCLFDFGKGSFASFDGSYAVAHAPKYDMEIHGTKGSIFVGGFGGRPSVLLQMIGKKAREVGPSDDFHLRWNLAWGVEETVRAILEKREPVTSAAFAVSVLRVMGALRESAGKKSHVLLT